MATIGVYGGAKFIGNDFVRPKIQKTRVEPVEQQPSMVPPAPVLAMPETQTSEVFSAQLPTEYQPSRLIKFFNLRTGFIALAIIAIVPLSVIVAKTNVVQAASTSVSKVALAISNNLRHTPPTFKMPANAILVRSSQLSNDIDAIESQSVTINLGAMTVTPEPSDIAHWFKTTAGPQSGSTLLAVNTAGISNYIASIIKANTKQPTNQSNGIGFSGSANATDQIVKQLLSCKGISISLSSTTIPPKIND